MPHKEWLDMTENFDFPSFKYGVFERPAGRMHHKGGMYDTGRINLSLYADMGTEEDGGILSLRSSPLADKVAFYVIGRDLALGLEKAEALPDLIKKIGKAVYEDCQMGRRMETWMPIRSTWHKDGGFIEHPNATIPGNPRPGEDYIVVRYFQNISGFKKDPIDVVATSETVEERLWLPNPGFILPTVGQNTRYGLPQETTPNFDIAVNAWVNADLGLTEEQAKAELSTFEFNLDRYGVYLFLAKSESGWNGALSVDIGDTPENGYEWVGSFPLSRPTKSSEYDRI